jgi:hypothetical protein
MPPLKMKATIKSANYPRPKKAGGNSHFGAAAATILKSIILKRSIQEFNSSKIYFGIFWY